MGFARQRLITSLVVTESFQSNATRCQSENLVAKRWQDHVIDLRCLLSLPLKRPGLAITTAISRVQ